MAKQVLRLASCAILSLFIAATVALADAPSKSADAAIGGIYTRPYGDKAEGVPSALLAQELVTASAVAIPAVIPVPMPEPSYLEILLIDLLSAAGLIWLGRRILRSRASRV
ncbi:MAG TPA: hypothetical protein VKU19_17350 [Bryobacteraceae bacterium]|nr:hypothetical protein [Bryobacteraceae bacterium]